MRPLPIPIRLRHAKGPIVPREEDVTPPPEVLAYYARFSEESRLGFGSSRLEFERTTEILARVLPGPPARVVDVGGAAAAVLVMGPL